MFRCFYKMPVHTGILKCMFAIYGINFMTKKKLQITAICFLRKYSNMYLVQRMLYKKEEINSLWFFLFMDITVVVPLR
ncbi:unnamed protein product [Ixodes persulcatus]